MGDQVEIIVRGVLIHAGKLMVCRNRKHGHIFLPGGHVDFNEPASQALQRECVEELGVALAVGEFLGACEAAFDQVKSKGVSRHHEINLVFQLVIPAGFDPQSLRSQEEHIAFDWLAVTQLADVKLLPMGIEQLIVRGAKWISAFDS